MQLPNKNGLNPNFNAENFKQSKLFIISINTVLSQLAFSHTAKSALLKFHCKDYTTKESHALS